MDIKRLCIKDNILLETCKSKRMFRIFFIEKIDEVKYKEFIEENVVNRKLYQLLKSLNDDLIEDIQIIDKRENEEDIQLTILINIMDKGIQHKKIIFTNKTKTNDMYSVKIMSKSKNSNVDCDIDNININFTYKDNNLETEMTFNNIGPVRNNCFEHINAFFFKKVMSRLKKHINEKNKN